MPNDFQPEAPQAPQAPQAPSVQTVGGEAVVAQPGTGIATIGTATARDMYLAAKAYRDELQDQWERLRSTRASVASAMREDNRTSADIDGLGKRLTQLDERIVDMEKQIATADARVAQAAGQPGAAIKQPAPPRDNSVRWDDLLGGGAVLSFALLFPFVIAYSRRIWRRSARVTVTLPPEVAVRMQAMEDAIESVAVEVERVGEGQRFITQALAESPRGLAAAQAEPIYVRSREAVLAERPL